MEHPSAFLPASVTDVLRAESSAAERQRQLTVTQLQTVYDCQWFTMFVPKAYGGSGRSLPDILRLEECLAWCDGSLGWVVTLCSGAGWFAGFMETSLSQVLLADPHACFAGSGAAGGTAIQTDAGFIVSGAWPYASGGLHATAFTANCHLHEDGVPLYNSDNTPNTKAFLFLPAEVTVRNSWKAVGMVATGSHAFAVSKRTLPPARCFAIDPARAVWPDAIFQFPFQSLAEVTLAVNLGGMSVRFLDLCIERLTTMSGRKACEAGKAALTHARARFFEVADNAWAQLLQRGSVPDASQQLMRAQSLALAKAARETVDSLYVHCGLSAAFTDTEINRVWRNFHTATQHAIFRT